MNGLQGWVLLLLVGVLVLRGLDSVRLLPGDLWVLGTAATIAIVQRLFLDQVALDEPLFAPLLLALPLVAAIRGGVRDGLVAAFGTWLALALMATVLPTRVAGDFPQEGFVLAAVLAAITAGGAGSLPGPRKHLAPWLGVAWLAFFLVRDRWLARSPTVLAVVLLTVAWTYVGAMFLPPRKVPT